MFAFSPLDLQAKLLLASTEEGLKDMPAVELLLLCSQQFGRVFDSKADAVAFLTEEVIPPSMHCETYSQTIYGMREVVEQLLALFRGIPQLEVQGPLVVLEHIKALARLQEILATTNFPVISFNGPDVTARDSFLELFLGEKEDWPKDDVPVHWVYDDKTPWERSSVLRSASPMLKHGLHLKWLPESASKEHYDGSALCVFLIDDMKFDRSKLAQNIEKARTLVSDGGIAFLCLNRSENHAAQRKLTKLAYRSGIKLSATNYLEIPNGTKARQIQQSMVSFLGRLFQVRLYSMTSKIYNALNFALRTARAVNDRHGVGPELEGFDVGANLEADGKELEKLLTERQGSIADALKSRLESEPGNSKLWEEYAAVYYKQLVRDGCNCFKKTMSVISKGEKLFFATEEKLEQEDYSLRWNHFANPDVTDTLGAVQFCASLSATSTGFRAVIQSFWGQDSPSTKVAEQIVSRARELLSKLSEQLGLLWKYLLLVGKLLAGTDLPSQIATIEKLKTHLFSATSGTLSPFYIPFEAISKQDPLYKTDTSTILSGSLRRNGSSLPVALKSIHQCEKPINLEMVYRECENMRLLKHENVVEFFGLSAHTGQVIIVLELLNCSMQTWLQSHKCLNLIETLSMLRDVAKGLEFIHSRGFVHRDIKPANLLVKYSGHQDQPPRVKIADFGTAKLQVDTYKTLTGSEGYLAPELFHRERHNFKVDVFSFGMVMWQMLHPDKDLKDEIRQIEQHLTSDQQVLEKLVQRDEEGKVRPRIDKKLQAELQKLILECWEIQPAKRPTMKRALRVLTKASSNPWENNRFKVLCLDGGGSRGIIMARILEKLQERIKRPVLQCFDFVCGTSTGGILALALWLAQKSPTDCVELYRELASKVFAGKGRGLTKATALYNVDTLEKVLLDNFQAKTLTRTTNDPWVFLVANDGEGPFLLRNYEHSPEANPHKGTAGWLATEAARATSAAPFYFKPYVKDHVHYYDGGVGHNNPAQLALEEIQDITGVEINNSISLLVSLGCGLVPEVKQPPRENLGFMDLLRDRLYGEPTSLASLLVKEVTQSEETHEYIERQSNDGNAFPYFRLNPPLEVPLALDVSGSILEDIMKVTDEYLATDGAAMFNLLVSELSAVIN